MYVHGGKKVKGQITNTYIPYPLIHRLLDCLSIASFLALIFMNYDPAYKWAIMLPVVYLVSAHTFLKRFMLQGIGSIALVGMYAFRMCMLPVLCAYGDFYIEPNKSLYMQYFGVAILLMCAECLIVFASLSYYSKKYQGKRRYFEKYNYTGVKESIFILFAIVAFIIYSYIVYTNKNFLSNHYRFLILSVDDASAFELENIALQNYGAVYYLAVILELTARPIIAFVLVNWALKKNNWFGIIFSILVGLFNILWISDRRILSFLVGVCCLLQVLLYVRSKFAKYTMYWMVGIFAVLTIVYCFLGEDTPIRVARKFQRYFSGPSLTAIGVGVYANFFQTPIEFLKLLFNDSLLLTGLFDSFSVRGYVLELCGDSGYSIWTPMFIGAIQYFHIFAPLLIIGIVKFLVYTDYRSQISTSDLRKMIFNYLTIAISVYMVMYSIELIYYNIIFIGGFYYLLSIINNKISIAIRISKNNYEQID